jgi:NAD(P)-dependent dehydrogenase (short-subunit alcohol dehydrogenase family)
MQTDCSQQTYVITGATSGIGLAVAEILASRGANLIGVGRSAERCRQAETRLSRLYPQSQVDYLLADLSVQADVRRLADQTGDLLAARGQAALNGLLNNAGTFTYWLALTPDGFETQWAVNHLAPFLLTRRLLPWLQAAPWSRVVTVSSASHYGARLDWSDIQLRRHYNGLRAYGCSKLANVLFTAELNRRLGARSPVRAFAADPGLVQTEIGLKGTPAVARWVWTLRRTGGISAERSAEGIVYLLTEPSLQSAPECYWKHAHPKSPSRRAQDPLTAERLWALSAKMTGLAEEVQYVTA